MPAKAFRVGTTQGATRTARVYTQVPVAKTDGSGLDWGAATGAATQVAVEGDPALRALSGTPAVVTALREKYVQNRKLEPADVASAFGFPLDEFQMDALTALAERRNVIVSAPTGSGKTVCGEAAVYLGSALGKRVIYTTPLKALSNQKYNDFCAQFGEERVGLLTGDTSINREQASILVVTTEVYRNMLYDVESIPDVHSVVLDEFHYMNDRDRGTVWEESVIHTPRDTLIVALSATMRNCKDIRDWFVNVQGPTDLIMSDFRPVPLLFKYADRTGISNLFDKLPNKRGQPRLNRRLLPGFEDEQRDGSGFKERRSYESGRGRRGRGGGRGRRDSTDGEFDRGGGRERRFGGGGRGGGGRGGGMQEVPSFGFTVRQLGNRDMLPAIFFIFSRAGCDKAAEEAAMEKTALVNEEEKAELRRRLTVFATNHKEVAAEDRIRLALKGIASHHAGLMPLWKSLVEELFQDNLIKVVFATETLAAGINMPARTTVITALSKRTNDGITSLTANELRQMCGRAGRRGKDTVGHSVIMKSRWEGAPEGFTLVTMPADPLVSKFSPNYGMVLNLLEQRPIAECKQIVERSFGSFMAQRRKGAAAAEEGDLEAEVEEAELLLQTVDVEELKALSKQAERLKSEERVLKFLRIQAAKNAQAIFEDTLPYAAPGTPLLLRPVVGSAEGEDMGPESAVLLDFALSASDSPLAFFAALTQRNKFRIVTHQDVLDMALDADLVSLALPDSGAGADGASAVQRVMDKIPPKQEWLKDGPEAYVAEGDVDTAFVSARIPTVPEPGPAPEVEAQRKRVEFVRAAVESSPIAALSKLSDLLKALRTVTQARVRRAPQKAGKIRPKQIEDGAASDGAWREFEACARCLEDFGMIKDGNVTSIGKLVGAINADNALWMGVNLLYSEELQTLGPHELAAAMSCLVSESGRPDIFVGYEASPNVQSFAEQSLDMQARLLSVQLSHGVDAAIPLDITYAGLVEAWALGASWNELVAMTSMQEGDIIRVLRRVLDALRQIPRLPFVADGMGVDAEFRVNARRALTLMDRFPVSDDVTYMVDEDETLDQGLAGSLKKEMAQRLAEKQIGSSAYTAERMGWTEDEVAGPVGSAMQDEVWFAPTLDEGDDGLGTPSSGSTTLFLDSQVDFLEGRDEDTLENEEDPEAEGREESGDDDEAPETQGGRRVPRKVGPKGRSNQNAEDEEWIRSLGLGKLPEVLPGDISI